MKHVKRCLLMLLVFIVNACGDDLMNPIPTIEINPGFASSGFNDANMVSLNETDTKKITYSRVYGVTRELTMQLLVDESVLDAYNKKNNTNYKLLQAEYYSMPSDVTFGVKSKNADFEVKFNPKKLYEASGSVEAASNYVLPIKAVSEETHGVIVDEATNTMLLHASMSPATISVYVPGDIITLDFVADSGAEEEISIEAVLNFSGFNSSYVTLEIDKDADLSIDGVDYKLLPETNYSFEAAALNELGEVVFNGKINADGLSETDQYILPCHVKSSNSHYVVDQSALIYYTVNITDLKVSIVDATATKAKAAYTSIATLTGDIEVTLNSIISDDLTVNFTYDPSLIAGFNAANSKSYKELPAGTVQIRNGKIGAWNKSGKFAYTIDISSLVLSDGQHYLVPLTLEENDLELGSVSGSKVIYLDVTRTLAGAYDLTVIANERTRNIESNIWLASECDRGGDPDWAAVMGYAQYGFGGDGKWYSVLFSVTDEDMPGKTGCKKVAIYTFLELIEETGGDNKVTENNSYFNIVTGELYIDCKLFESWFDQTYKETYSFKRR